MKRITYSLSNILQDNAKCVNPTVVFEPMSSCVSIACVHETRNTQGHLTAVSVEVDVDEDALNCEKCFRYTIDCADCEKCPPQTFTKCFCQSVNDCPDCTICVEGDCLPKCPGKYCDPNTEDCVDCDDNHPCPCNQICVQGNCQCPVDLPYKDERDCCVACSTEHPCPPCFVCIDGQCTPKECPEGFCNPDTGDCTGCLNSGQCTGDHECCIDGQCKCCPGYYYDTYLQTCVEIPDCTTDTDCPECYVCIAGACEPLICPPGTECVNGNCMRPCDCISKNCPRNSTCYPNSPDNCYCIECGGACVEGSCYPGCVCVNGVCTPNTCEGPCQDKNDCGSGCGCLNNECVPCDTMGCNNCSQVDGCACINTECVPESPCQGPCITGQDCGPGCGCLNGICTPCSTSTCNNCKLIIGCTCTDNTCVEDNCSKPCTSGADCAPGCGCWQGNCTKCETISCANGGICPEGCACNPQTGKCGTNPCPGVYCSVDGDCGENCVCYQGLCNPCSSFSCITGQCATVNGCTCIGGDCVLDNPDPEGLLCNDQFSIIKLDAGCDLKAELETESCCECSDIGIGIEDYVYSGINPEGNIILSRKVVLRKGNFGYYSQYLLNDKLCDTGIINENPLSGQVRFECDVLYQEVTAGQHILVPNGSTYHTTEIYDYAFFNNSCESNSTTTSIPSIGKIVYLNSKYYAVVKVYGYMVPMSNFIFPNSCIYKANKVKLFEVISNSQWSTIKEDAFLLTKKVLCGDALIEWYKGTGSVDVTLNAVPFRRIYASKLGNKYVDVLYSYTDGLEFGKHYGARINCSCQPWRKYSCFGTQSLASTPLIFCDPTDFQYHLEDCGTKLVFDEDVIVNCDVYTGGTKPIYEVLFNGVVKFTKTLPNNNKLYAAGDELSNGTTAIQQVILNFKDDYCNSCAIIKTPVPGPLGVTLNIESASCDLETTVIAMIGATGGQGPLQYELFKDGNSISTGTLFSNPTSISIPNEDGTYSVIVTDDNACTGTDTVVYQITGYDFANKLVIQPSCQALTGYGLIEVTNLFTESVSVTVLTHTQTVLAGSSYTFNTGIINPGNVTLVANIVGNNICTYTTVVDIDCCTPNPLDTINFNVTYTCAEGFYMPIQVLGGHNLIYAIDGNGISSGMTYDAGSYTITISNGICTTEYPIVVPECFKCVTGVCTLQTAPYANGALTQLECDNTCTICTDNDLDITFSGTDITYCNTGIFTAMASGGTAPYSYILDLVIAPDNGNPLAGGTPAQFLGTVYGNGTHTVRVTDANGCTFTKAFRLECLV